MLAGKQSETFENAVKLHLIISNRSRRRKNQDSRVTIEYKCWFGL